MRFIDLFAGLGGFRLALEQLGHECVFACEKAPSLRDVYTRNFPSSPEVAGDIRNSHDRIPPHDVLCAGFPCQPFSKAGAQAGLDDPTDGTLFREILRVIAAHRPTFVLMENVGNFERHDHGRTWNIARASLEKLGYRVVGTQHVGSGGSGLLSPHHLGYPHHRERFFIVASSQPLPLKPFPRKDAGPPPLLESIVQPPSELVDRDVVETRISDHRLRCINHWNDLLQALPEYQVSLPSFPIWADEYGADYPYETTTPWAAGLPLETVPPYAATRSSSFPRWKVTQIRNSRRWLSSIRPYVPEGWFETLSGFSPSLRKLEWNCQGEDRDLWSHVLQFRPSGLRAKRYSTSPSLVAIGSSQVPILGPEGRYLTRTEGLRLQGFPDGFHLPDSRSATFQALGNAVHAGVAREVARRLLGGDQPPEYPSDIRARTAANGSATTMQGALF